MIAEFLWTLCVLAFIWYNFFDPQEPDPVDNSTFKERVWDNEPLFLKILNLFILGCILALVYIIISELINW